jgi:hypothetical protein
MQFQGNALWIPPIAPELTVPPEVDGAKEEGGHRALHRSRLVVHASGPILERLQLSWVNEEQPPSAPHSARSPAPPLSCWMSGGRWSSAEVGTVRQLAPLNQFPPLLPSPFLHDPPTCFARGTTEAALFQLLPLQRQEERVKGEERKLPPFYLAPVQKLQVRARVRTTFLAELFRRPRPTSSQQTANPSSSIGVVP